MNSLGFSTSEQWNTPIDKEQNAGKKDNYSIMFDTTLREKKPNWKGSNFRTHVMRTNVLTNYSITTKLRIFLGYDPQHVLSAILTILPEEPWRVHSDQQKILSMDRQWKHLKPSIMPQAAILITLKGSGSVYKSINTLCQRKSSNNSEKISHSSLPY